MAAMHRRHVLALLAGGTGLLAGCSESTDSAPATTETESVVGDAEPYLEEALAAYDEIAELLAAEAEKFDTLDYGPNAIEAATSHIEQRLDEVDETLEEGITATGERQLLSMAGRIADWFRTLTRSVSEATFAYDQWVVAMEAWNAIDWELWELADSEDDFSDISFELARQMGAIKSVAADVDDAIMQPEDLRDSVYEFFEDSIENYDLRWTERLPRWAFTLAVIADGKSKFAGGLSDYWGAALRYDEEDWEGMVRYAGRATAAFEAGEAVFHEHEDEVPEWLRTEYEPHQCFAEAMADAARAWGEYAQAILDGEEETRSRKFDEARKAELRCGDDSADP